MNVRRSRSTTRSTNFDSARPNKSLSVNIHLRGQQDHTLAVVEDLGVSFVVDTPTRRIGDTAPRQFDADYKSAKRSQVGYPPDLHRLGLAFDMDRRHRLKPDTRPDPACCL